jgi:hypothetical protein
MATGEIHNINRQEPPSFYEGGFIKSNLHFKM